MPRRYLTALRRLESKRPPLRTLVVGPEGPAQYLVRRSAEALDPTDVLRFWGADPEVVPALSQKPTRRRRRLVVWYDLPDPTPDAVGAVRELRGVRGTWLVATSSEDPDPVWADLFDPWVSARMTPKSVSELVQRRLGGVDSLTARRLLDRVGWDPGLALGECAKVRIVCRRIAPTVGDIEELVPLNAGADFTRALIACRREEALGAIPWISRPAWVVASLEARLLALWSLVEHRPPVHTMKVRDVASSLALPYPLTQDLVPVARLYSRSKIRSRLQALAVADEEIRRGGREGVFEVLVAMW